MNVPDATAEEVAADVLMAVHQKVKTFRFDGRGKLTTWIFEIAKNRAIDYHRTSKLEIQEFDASTYVGHPQLEADPPERENGEILWIRTQLSRFSDQDQQILKWRALDFPFGQIAEWLGINEGTARVRHKRALDKIKQQAKTAPPSGEPHHE
jgi:RNA polymerase sigma factor (sigma-70 family)